MNTIVVKVGQVWTKEEKRRPGRAVLERQRRVLVQDVSAHKFSPYVRVYDAATNRFTWLRALRLQREWRRIA